MEVTSQVLNAQAMQVYRTAIKSFFELRSTVIQLSAGFTVSLGISISVSLLLLFGLFHSYNASNTHTPRQCTYKILASHAIPPHEVLLQYMHPATSLWPPTYLRAFKKAQEGDGVLELRLKTLKRDLKKGTVVLRGEEAEILRALARPGSGVRVVD